MIEFTSRRASRFLALRTWFKILVLSSLACSAASPIAADGRVYLASQSGTITVIDADSDQLKVLASNALGEKITATPALAEDKLYVRTEKHLFAFGVR